MIKATSNSKPKAIEVRKLQTVAQKEQEKSQARNKEALRSYNAERDKELKRQQARDAGVKGARRKKAQDSDDEDDVDEVILEDDDTEVVLEDDATEVILEDDDTDGSTVLSNDDNAGSFGDVSCETELKSKGSKEEEHDQKGKRSMVAGGETIIKKKMRKYPSMEDAEYIERIIGHKHDLKNGRKLKARWDNGYVGWHYYDTVVLDEYTLVKEYILKQKLDQKGWTLPTKEDAKKIVEILDDRLVEGVPELECVYDNGFREWQERRLVEKKYRKLVKEYFEE